KASNQELCGKLTERSISSRVGRTVVICNKLGDFRLMSVAVRRKDQIKRVYVVPEAKEALLTLLQEDWGRDFNHYLTENGMDTVSVESLGLD
ncbi:MAG: hypothetical protein NTV00_03815, partial [Methylococcales bacterium]|nr:hypothetical protein [Methylococcales bacterium]